VEAVAPNMEQPSFVLIRFEIEFDVGILGDSRVKKILHYVMFQADEAQLFPAPFGIAVEL
jgi:hypothetical protein